MVSPRPSWVSAELSTRVCPPSWRMATSKDTRVRVDGLLNIKASMVEGGSRGMESGVLFSLYARALAISARNEAASNWSISMKCRSAIAPAPEIYICLRAPDRRPQAALSRSQAISICSGSTISGGSSRTTLPAAGTVSIRSSNSASISC